MARLLGGQTAEGLDELPLSLEHRDGVAFSATAAI